MSCVSSKLLLSLWQAHPPSQVLQLLHGNQDHIDESQVPHLLRALLVPGHPNFNLPWNAHYVEKLLKVCIRQLEAVHAEVPEELYNCYTEAAVQLAGLHAASWVHKTFCFCTHAPSFEQLLRGLFDHKQSKFHLQETEGGQQTGWVDDLQSTECEHQKVEGRQQEASLDSHHAAINAPAQLAASVSLEGDGCNHAPRQPAGTRKQLNFAQGCRHLDAPLLVTLSLSTNILEGGTGCHEWTAGLLMSEFVLSHPHLFAGKVCLELGCGAGLLGICLTHSPSLPKRIILTDGHPQTLKNCMHNLALNDISCTQEESDEENNFSVTEVSAGLQLSHTPGQTTAFEGADSASVFHPSVQSKHPVIECALLKWEEDYHGPIPDVILGSDLLYDPSCVPALVKMLYSLLTLSPSQDNPDSNSLPEGSSNVPPTNGVRHAVRLADVSKQVGSENHTRHADNPHEADTYTPGGAGNTAGIKQSAHSLHGADDAHRCRPCTRGVNLVIDRGAESAPPEGTAESACPAGNAESALGAANAKSTPGAANAESALGAGTGGGFAMCNECVTGQAAGRPAAREAFLATKIRNPTTMELFLTTAEAAGLRVENVDMRERRVRLYTGNSKKDLSDSIVLHRVTVAS